MTDNFFICRHFDWRIRRITYLDRVMRKIVLAFGADERKLRWPSDVVDKIVAKTFGAAPLPIFSGAMTNIEQRINIYHLVAQTLAYDVSGELVEVGCNEGQTAVLIAEIMRNYKTRKGLHVYDSFEGLPQPGAMDGSDYEKGQLPTTEDILIRNFEKFGMPLPSIYKGWFDDTLPTKLPDVISFAHLDGDLYDSIMVSLKYVYPKLARGAVCLVDDYCDPAVNPGGWNRLPGVKKACDEFLADKAERIEFLYSGDYSHGYFRKM